MDTTTVDVLGLTRAALKSQYRAAFAMFKEAIDACPEELWLDTTHGSAYWQVAYHTLFYTHMYLQPSLSLFKPWTEHQTKVQYQNGLAGPPKDGSTLPLIPEPYSKAQVLAFLAICDHMVDGVLDSLDLLDPQSGFPWYSCSKLEHQIISVRHIQHHTAQLGDRLKAAGGAGLAWLGHA